jgi:hypothetical protein
MASSFELHWKVRILHDPYSVATVFSKAVLCRARLGGLRDMLTWRLLSFRPSGDDWITFRCPLVRASPLRGCKRPCIFFVGSLARKRRVSGPPSND